MFPPAPRRWQEETLRLPGTPVRCRALLREAASPF
jgi:hypothetical protein